MMFLLPCLPSLTPSIPLSHYVLLFHITAKQFEAPKGSPPDLAFFPSLPSLIFLLWIRLASSWPTWRVQYILRSYKLSKQGWHTGSLAAWRTPSDGKKEGGELTPAEERSLIFHVAKLPAPLESKNVFSSREIGSITWPSRVRNVNAEKWLLVNSSPFTL